jgi:hypothetical protein
MKFLHWYSYIYNAITLNLGPKQLCSLLQREFSSADESEILHCSVNSPHAADESDATSLVYMIAYAYDQINHPQAYPMERNTIELMAHTTIIVDEKTASYQSYNIDRACIYKYIKN